MASLPQLLSEALVVRKLGSKAARAAKKAGKDDVFSELKTLLGNEVAGTGRRAHPDPLSGGRVAQRFPEGVKRSEDPLRENLLVNMATLEQDPAHAAKTAELIKSYPLATREMREMTDPMEVNRAFRDLLVENKLALHDMTPAPTRARTKKWYHGANRIANERAREVGIDPVSSSGAYAAMSPQKDWEQNVYLGDALLRALARDPKVDRAMLEYAKRTPAFTKEPKRWKEHGRPEGEQLPVEMIDEAMGRRLSNLSPAQQAAVIRAFDEVYNVGNRGRRAYHQISPEGDYLDFAQNADGSFSAPGWGSFRDIEKAASIAQSGGNMDVISDLLGRQHKVRDFHNNIVNPKLAAKYGDYTADTHDIASSNFQPMSGDTPEVKQGMSGPPKSLGSGLRGLYPIYADAGRIAAAERGLHPYQMQSITWEAVRKLFPAEFKTNENMVRIRGIWQAASDGLISRKSARKAIVRLASPSGQLPAWLAAALGAMGLLNEENENA